MSLASGELRGVLLKHCLRAAQVPRIPGQRPCPRPPGGVYFYSHRLAGKKWGPVSSWISGWFNLLGGAASTAGVAFTTAQLLANYWLLATGGAARTAELDADGNLLDPTAEPVASGYLAPQARLIKACLAPRCQSALSRQRPG